MSDSLPRNNTPNPLYKAKTAYSDKWIRSHSYLHLNDGFVLLASSNHAEGIRVRGFKEDIFEISSPDKEVFMTFANEHTICAYINRDDQNGNEIFTNDLVDLKRKDGAETYHGIVVFDEAVSAYAVRVDGKSGTRCIHFADGDEVTVRGNIFD